MPHGTPSASLAPKRALAPWLWTGPLGFLPRAGDVLVVLACGRLGASALLPDLPEQLLLPAGEVGWDHHLHRRHQPSASGASQPRHAQARKLYLLAVLASGRNGNRYSLAFHNAIQLHGGPEHGVYGIDPNHRVEVVSLPVKRLVLCYLNGYDKVARRVAANAGFAALPK